MPARQLRNLCSARLENLAEKFATPVSKDDSFNPILPFLIYSEAEWKAEILQENINHRDAIFLCGSSPDEGNYCLVFFERLHNQFATYSLILGRPNASPLVVDSQIHVDMSKGNVLGAGSLRLECDAPMRMWRMIYNGIMKDTKTNAEVHARIACRFSSMSHTFEYPKHVPASKIIRALCDNGTPEQQRERVLNVTSDLCGHEQAVTFYMETTIGDNYKTFMLFGSKLRLIGDRTLFQKCNRHYFAYINNGTVMHALRLNPNKCTGFGFTATGYHQVLQKARWDQRSVRFTVDGEELVLSADRLTKIHSSAQSVNNALIRTAANTTGSIKIKDETFEYCLFEVSIPQYRLLDNNDLFAFRYALPCQASFTPLSVTTEMEICAAPALTGGKGSSLAVLSAIANEFKTFLVPKAVVLTTAAHEIFLRQDECQAVIEDFLEKCSQCRDDSQLSNISKQCVSDLGEMMLPTQVIESLQGNLEVLFGTFDESKTFAVRSSAIGEDSDDTSAAGQMQTFLSVKGFREICKAVAKCWASQYSFTALKYSKTFTQSTRPGMAVVVQEMVPADKSGIMFTCDPVTDNPNIITITANYGLGESVVSGLVEGDSVAVQASASQRNLTIKEKRIGSKLQMIEQDVSGGTKDSETDEEKSKQMCISDAEIIGLSVIGLEISRSLDGPRDMEWAIHGDLIYLLQCRPVTTQFRASDFEITHDLSTSLYTNREMLCRVNYEEVLPGALSPLTMSLVVQTCFGILGFADFAYEFPKLFCTSPYTFQWACNIGKTAFMNTSLMIYGGKNFVKSTETTMFGSDLSGNEALSNGIYHSRKLTMAEKRKLVSLFWKFYTPLKEVVRVSREGSQTFALTESKGNSKSILMTILSELPKMKPCLMSAMKANMASQWYNMMTFKTLKSSQDKNMETPDLMMLMSQLLRSNHDVESADIPKNLKALALTIRKNDPEAFAKMSPEDALKFLKEDEGPAGEHFAKFMKRHGYRCYKEFDLSSKTWEMDPIPLVKALQANVKCPIEEEAKRKKFKVKHLPKRPSLMQRRTLRWEIKRTKYAVYAREIGKAGFIKCLCEVRKHVNMLGAQLVKEGALPDERLVHFLTVDELFRLCDTGSPTLVAKAIRRERLHDRLNRVKFPIILCGLPKPIDENVDVDPNCKTLHGTPVAHGVAVGPARVIHNYETEAHLICKGDILITQATDTGWTPYFPLLGGVVTEIGGLVSHGAVVAREYGLPAVVGVQGATRIIKDGVKLRIDGTQGSITIMDEDKQEEMTDDEIEHAESGDSEEDGKKEKDEAPTPDNNEEEAGKEEAESAREEEGGEATGGAERSSDDGDKSDTKDTDKGAVDEHSKTFWEEYINRQREN